MRRQLREEARQAIAGSSSSPWRSPMRDRGSGLSRRRKNQQLGIRRPSRREHASCSRAWCRWEKRQREGRRDRLETVLYQSPRRDRYQLSRQSQSSEDVVPWVSSAMASWQWPQRRPRHRRLCHWPRPPQSLWHVRSNLFWSCPRRAGEPCARRPFLPPPMTRRRPNGLNVGMSSFVGPFHLLPLPPWPVYLTCCAAKGQLPVAAVNVTGDPR